jgi:hypothetical protein
MTIQRRFRRQSCQSPRKTSPQVVLDALSQMTKLDLFTPTPTLSGVEGLRECQNR